jgi:hypothetical protein
VQEEEVRWKKGSTGPTGGNNLFYGKGNGSLPFRNRIFLHYIDISSKSAVFDFDRVSHTVLRGRRYYRVYSEGPCALIKCVGSQLKEP